MGAASLAGCQGNSAYSTLDKAEQSYRDGRYALAQQLCDSIVLGERADSMSTAELCRLSLLFMRLADTAGDIDANTAFAARTLKAALNRNADSTLMFVSSVPVEDQARLAILTAINEAQSAPEITDTIGYDY